MSDRVKNVDTPLMFATRLGLTWNRVNSGDLINWDDVCDFAVAAYWRKRCGLPERRERRAA